MDKVPKHNLFNTNTPSSDPTEIMAISVYDFSLKFRFL
jgi:hypothetical protein